MEDEADQLNNLCADLVSLARMEPGLKHLFHGKAAGEWVPLAELYRLTGVTGVQIKPELAAAWLPSPSADSGYAVILFCDDELGWCMTAYYNVGWLFRDEATQLTPAAPPRPAR